MKVYSLLIVILALIFIQEGFCQNIEQGKVTFVTSNTVYVRFANTEGINLGDTLSLVQDGVNKMCLLVKSKSSSSCACTPISDQVINKDDIVQASLLNVKNDVNKTSESEQNSRPSSKERINGRLSAASYSTSSSEGGSTHRTMYRFAVNADHIGNSNFSFQTHMSYRQNFLPSDRVVSTQRNLFNIYTMSLTYQAKPGLTMSVGRRVNNKVVSLGPVDGLQLEKSLRNFYMGTIVGTRPDIFDQSYNAKLFQYGGYVGFNKNRGRIKSQSTVGLLQQTNNGAIDRRYMYLQNNASVGKFSLFSTMELDLYNPADSTSGNSSRLTNFYLSARYRINRRTNVSVSYDTRKRILYYETFRNEIESLLANDDTRQTIRARINTRPFKNVNVGLGYSRRFQNDGFNKAQNMNGYVSLSSLPQIGGRVSLNYNVNSSEYLKSDIISVRHSRSLIKRKVDLDLYYRFVKYRYINRELQSEQNFVGANISYRIKKNLRFHILGEASSRPEERNYRINLKLIKRFNKN